MEKDLRTIIVFALRYALPRHTYSFGLVSDFILQHIEFFTDSDLMGMIKDCDMYYPDADFCGNVCDQPKVDRFKARLQEILKRRVDYEKLSNEV